jgi:ABC-type maltose transport system permease subunit
MKDYLRRTAKFILYMTVIFFLVLVLYPLLIEGISPAVTLREMFQNQKFMLFLAFLVAYALIYPLVGFVKIKRHLNGTFADNRGVFEKAFETLNYIKTADDPDKIVYRRKSKYARFAQWYEDSIVISPQENPVVISGMRKTVTRIDRLIDQFLIKASE